MRIFQPLYVSALLISLCIFMSCTKDNVDPQPDDDTKGKLLPRKMTSFPSNDSAILTYDNENHLIETIEYSEGVIYRKTVYTYQNGKPVKQEFYHDYPDPLNEYNEISEAGPGKMKQVNRYKSDDKWTEWASFYILDSKGRIETGEWQDGTIFQKLTWDAQGRVSALWYKESVDLFYTYKYDDKKGMFSSVNTPYFFDAFLDIFPRNYGVNNLTEMTETYINGDGETKTTTEKVTYKYNEEGYPVEMRSELDLDITDIFIEYQEAK